MEIYRVCVCVCVCVCVRKKVEKTCYFLIYIHISLSEDRDSVLSSVQSAKNRQSKKLIDQKVFLFVAATKKDHRTRCFMYFL